MSVEPGVFFERVSPDRRWAVVIEDDGVVAFAYLVDLRDGQRVVGDVWLYNVGPTPAEVDWNGQRQTRMPFLQAASYALNVPFTGFREDSDVVCTWSGHRVRVEVDGVEWACLEPGARPGWSRLCARVGPLARPLGDLTPQRRP